MTGQSLSLSILLLFRNPDHEERDSPLLYFEKNECPFVQSFEEDFFNSS